MLEGDEAAVRGARRGIALVLLLVLLPQVTDLLAGRLVRKAENHEGRDKGETGEVGAKKTRLLVWDAVTLQCSKTRIPFLGEVRPPQCFQAKVHRNILGPPPAQPSLGGL